MTPRVAVVIPARLGSIRLTEKVLIPIEGRSMLEWVWRAASDVPEADSVWIATDSEKIASTVSDFGGQVLMTRKDHASGTDRVAEAAERIDAEVIVNLQADQPTMPAAVLSALVRGFLADHVPMGTLVAPITRAADRENPARVKVVARQDGRALYFSRAPIPFDRDGTASDLGLLHLGVYIYRKEFLRIFTRLPVSRLESREMLEQLRALEHGYEIGLVAVDYDGAGVDTPEDLNAVTARLRTLACSS
ncbi:MAG: 3-deoxy-manno-octulosonate cytidylyltransferase [Armatimonadetes bacterium]|nr:3-deoxy-manno-octulosonate cytidylyltransferase [Armatimonadota bacterium]